MSDITTFLRTDRIACDRLVRRVDHPVKRRSWLAAFSANARFESALNQQDFCKGPYNRGGALP
jgi:hypothetical protein